MPRVLFDRSVQVMAVCDADASRLSEARDIVESNYAQLLPKGTYSGCAAVADFRDVLQRRDIDRRDGHYAGPRHDPIAIARGQPGRTSTRKPVSMTVRQGRKRSRRCRLTIASFRPARNTVRKR
jgi:hypothetical protein